MRQSWFGYVGYFFLAALVVFALLSGVLFGFGALGNHLMTYPLDALAVLSVAGAGGLFVLAGRRTEVQIGSQIVTWRHLIAGACGLVAVAMVVPYIPVLLDGAPDILVFGFISGVAIAIAMALLAVGVLRGMLGIESDVDDPFD